MLVASIKTFVFYLINLIIVTAVTACFLGQFCGVLFSCPVSPPPSFSLTCSLPVCVLVGVVSATERRTCDSTSHQLSPHKPGLLFAPVPDCSVSTSVSPALSQVSYHAFLISDVTFSCLCSTLFSARLTCRCLLHCLHLLTWVSCTFL